MTVYLRATAFDPWAEISACQSMLGQPGKYGATASFVGTLRDLNEGDVVLCMTLEHYPGMTEKFLQKIAAEAAARWDILDSLIIHRYGQLLPNDPIVLVAVWATYRAAAFAACRFLIDELKHRAPFWKKETLPDGTRWVEGNTP